MPAIRFTTLQANTATGGGGASTGWDAKMNFECCEFLGNIATENGGGFYSHSAGVAVSLSFESCVVAGNSANKGGGLDFEHDSFPSITGCTVYGNTAAEKGGGVSCRRGSEATICNTIIWDNDSPSGPEIFVGSKTEPSVVTISSSDVEGGQTSCEVAANCTLNWGAGMIDADPAFVDPARDDFHLTLQSPCRNTGDDSAVTAAEDFEGDPRIVNGRVDMGADEFFFHLYHVGDAVPGSPLGIRTIGVPGMPFSLAYSAISTGTAFLPLFDAIVSTSPGRVSSLSRTILARPGIRSSLVLVAGPSCCMSAGNRIAFTGTSPPAR